MARYFDADKLLHRLPNDLPYKASVKRVLVQAPAEDVEKVKHGEWIECSNELNKYCSVCKKVHGTIYERPPFCENCGAKMDGGKAE